MSSDRKKTRHSFKKETVQSFSSFYILIDSFIIIKKCTQIHLTPVNPLALFLPGCLMNLSPPRVVGVVNDEKNLAPEEHQGWVGGDEALYHAVQTF